MIKVHPLHLKYAVSFIPTLYTCKHRTRHLENYFVRVRMFYAACILTIRFSLTVPPAPVGSLSASPSIRPAQLGPPLAQLPASPSCLRSGRRLTLTRSGPAPLPAGRSWRSRPRGQASSSRPLCPVACAAGTGGLDADLSLTPDLYDQGRHSPPAWSPL